MRQLVHDVSVCEVHLSQHDSNGCLFVARCLLHCFEQATDGNEVHSARSFGLNHVFSVDAFFSSMKMLSQVVKFIVLRPFVWSVVVSGHSSPSAERLAFFVASMMPLIATFLDAETSKIDALIAEQRRLIELLKEKRQAVISHAVTKGQNPDATMKASGIEWLGDVPEHSSVVALKHLVSRPIIDGPHVSPQKHDQGVPFISAESIGKGFIDFDKKWGYISPEDHKVYSQRYSPQRGDILMVKLGATTGVPAIVETDTDFSVWVPLAAIRLKDQIQPYLIFHVLRSNNLRVAYQLSWTFGTQQTLGLGTISNLQMPVPPAQELQEIVNYLDAVLPGFDSLEAEATRAIDLLQERRTALISAAVTDKIDVREISRGGAENAEKTK